MQISTVYNGEQITSELLNHTRSFLEVQITSPYANHTTSLSVPTFARAHTQYQGEMLESRCNQLLIELYEFGSLIDKHFSTLVERFRSSSIPALQSSVNELAADLRTRKQGLRKLFIKNEITQREYQSQLKEVRGLINNAQNRVCSAIDDLFEGSPFDGVSFDLRAMLVQQLTQQT
ncbi:hypothetical protein [Arenicella xantha]|uniref:Uncharacterized protein n=1 Tax=Arenicella xantha TaxID=644221 RepID=A0A395JNT3_9GAMM|nr:hypothetical protein [Arenicella xantha]RBP52973.1 hypothetical protein DFR28_101357 [Arenicella xantha]